ncbi:MAG: hypothetical protein Tsb0010_07580 [Parvularculaceae bacterium]
MRLISAIGNRARRWPRTPMKNAKRSRAGFTLVEVMTAIFILGLAAGLVILTQPVGREGAAGAAAEEVAARLRAAAREAVVSGEPIGVAFGSDRLEFYRYRQGVWRPAAPAPAPLPARAGLTLAEGPPRRRENGDDGLRDVEIPYPDIIYSPTGEATEFEAWIARGDGRARISGDAAGRILVGAAP